MSDNRASTLAPDEAQSPTSEASKSIWFRDSLGADNPERTASVYRQVKGVV
jgi:hypothetical protein